MRGISAMFFLPFILSPFPSSSAIFEPSPPSYSNLTPSDAALVEFPLNLEYLEAEFFLFGAFGYGLDRAAPNLASGGPSPRGARKANLSLSVADIVAQFAFQEVGHLRAIRSAVHGFPRPSLDLSPSNFAKIVDSALGRSLQPPFDPYQSDVNYLLASYLIPYVGLTGYVGANPLLNSSQARKLVAGLLGVESAQDAVIRTLLYEVKDLHVAPYEITVAEFSAKFSELRDRLGGAGVKDEGLVVPMDEGAEGKLEGNVIAGDSFSMAYSRSPQEILRIVYGSGSEARPGGFFPNGASGEIAQSFYKAA